MNSLNEKAFVVYKSICSPCSFTWKYSGRSTTFGPDPFDHIKLHNVSILTEKERNRLGLHGDTKPPTVFVQLTLLNIIWFNPYLYKHCIWAYYLNKNDKNSRKRLCNLRFCGDCDSITVPTQPSPPSWSRCPQSGPRTTRNPLNISRRFLYQ